MLLQRQWQNSVTHRQLGDADVHPSQGLVDMPNILVWPMVSCQIPCSRVGGMLLWPLLVVHTQLVCHR